MVVQQPAIQKIGTKYAVYSKNPLTLSLVSDVKPTDLQENYFYVPIKAIWHENASYIFILARIGTLEHTDNQKTNPFEIIKYSQVDRDYSSIGTSLILNDDVTSGGFDGYSMFALALLKQRLGDGAITNTHQQPSENFEFNNELFQWSVAPIHM